MGKGHSNLPESKFSVLTKFRPKDTNLHQIHYEVSTNMGLCQSNMTYLIKCKRTTYHWVLKLFGKMGLRTVDSIEAVIARENEERMRRLENQKTDRAKQERVAFKQKRGYHFYYIGNENGSFIAPAMLWVSFVHLAVDYTLLNNIIDNDIAVRCRTLMF